MPIKILMPALSPTMTEGNLVKWHKKEGDTVKAGQLLAEIETDKATMEVEAVDEGILGKILVRDGTEHVKVNTLIAVLIEEGEDQSAMDGLIEGASTSVQGETVSAEGGIVQDDGKAVSVVVERSEKASLSGNQKDEGRIFASPLARRIAGQKNIDLTEITGTGPKGRIIKADVESFVPFQKKAASSFGVSASLYQDIPLNSMRKVIARRLQESKQTIPHFYLSVDCEMDQLLALREQVNGLPNAQKISVNDFVIKGCALALKAVPEANATFHDTFVRQYESADISVAVAIDGGLITPIVRQAELKTIRDISLEMKDLAARARAGKLRPEEFQGGGMSLSNLGMYGVKEFSAIVNPPQATILAVGASRLVPVVKEGVIVPATVMTCTLSVNHAIVDGAVGARFLSAFKEAMENPLMLLV